MKTPLICTLALGLCVTAASTLAQEVGRVISSTPVVQQVGVPRQVCTQQPMIVSETKSGAGALMGALAGGGLGNAVGQGTGKALATVVGVMGGAILGNNIEGGQQQVQNVQNCTTQTFYENRNVGYNVVYEYGGKQYTVQMPNDPGPSVQLQITPVGASAPATVPMTQTEMLPAGPVTTTTYIQPAVMPQPVYAPPVYAAPYYSYPYYAPIGLSIGLGHRGGYYGGGHRHYRR